jgi:hypothetical protein
VGVPADRAALGALAYAEVEAWPADRSQLDAIAELFSWSGGRCRALAFSFGIVVALIGVVVGVRLPSQLRSRLPSETADT